MKRSNEGNKDDQTNDSFDDTGKRSKVDMIMNKDRQDEKQKSLYARCSPSAFQAMIGSLSATQKQKIINAGYPGLVHFKPNTLKNRHYIAWLMDHFDPETMSMRFSGERDMEFNEDAVTHMFGLPNEGCLLPYFEENDGVSKRQQLIELFQKRNCQISTQDNNINHISPSLLAKSISKCNNEKGYEPIDDDTVVRIFYMVAINTILCPDTSPTIRSKDIIWAEQFEQINWCKALVSGLKAAGRKWEEEKKDPKKTIYLNGSLVSLQIFYLDHLMWDGVDIHPKLTPRCIYIEPDSINKLMAADTKDDGTYGKLKHKSSSETCYIHIPKKLIPSTHTIPMPKPDHCLEVTLMEVMKKAYESGKGDQVGGVLKQFAEDRRYADECITKGKQFREAAYQNTIEQLQSILTNDHGSNDHRSNGSNDHSVHDLYDEYFITKSRSFPEQKVLDFEKSYYIERSDFIKCFKPEGKMDNMILDLKCQLLNASWHDRVALSQRTVGYLKSKSMTILPEITAENKESIKVIFVPINIENKHWVLAVVIKDKLKIQIFDSSKGLDNVDTTVKTVLDELDKCLPEWHISFFDQVEAPIEQQGNPYDCGFRALMYIEHFGKEDLQRIDDDATFEYRKSLMVELYNHEENRARPKFDHGKANISKEFEPANQKNPENKRPKRITTKKIIPSTQGPPIHEESKVKTKNARHTKAEVKVAAAVEPKNAQKKGTAREKSPVDVKPTRHNPPRGPRQNYNNVHKGIV